jgi:hypothetical protein
MKERFIDRETGWLVTRETRVLPQSAVKVVEETVTDPQSGRVYRGTRLASRPGNIAEWVQAIEEAKQETALLERRVGSPP